MTIVLAPADYVILTVLLGSGILGLFSGFSGALAFLAGLVAATGVVRWGYTPLSHAITTEWLCLVVTGCVTLLAFGLVRLIVKKTVHGLLAQPADALFGALIAALAGGCAALAIVYGFDSLGILSVDSLLLDCVRTRL